MTNNPLKFIALAGPILASITCRDGARSMVVLPPDEQVVVTGQFCAGIAQFPCPEGFACVDDPRDDCDPAAGGVDCGGVCVAGPTDPDAVDRNGDRVICARAASSIGSLRAAFIDNELPGGSCPTGFSRVTLPALYSGVTLRKHGSVLTVRQP
jgi:hypothetical protein